MSMLQTQKQKFIDPFCHLWNVCWFNFGHDKHDQAPGKKSLTKVLPAQIYGSHRRRLVASQPPQLQALIPETKKQCTLNIHTARW